MITEVDKPAGLESLYDLACSFTLCARGGASPKLGEINDRNVER
jgi:hypothetical protein